MCFQFLAVYGGYVYGLLLAVWIVTEGYLSSWQLPQGVGLLCSSSFLLILWPSEFVCLSCLDCITLKRNDWPCCGVVVCLPLSYVPADSHAGEECALLGSSFSSNNLQTLNLLCLSVRQKKTWQISIYHHSGGQQAHRKSDLMYFQPITSLVTLFSGNGNEVFTELHPSLVQGINP